MHILKHFYGSIIVCIIGLFLGFYFIEHSFLIFYTILFLALLEISLSFDNAIINAKVLSSMSEFWQKAFLWIGLPIAVFGMRLLFPILLVDLTTDLDFMQVFNVAINNPIKYEEALNSGLPIICTFGGGFLLMVFLNFFIKEENETNWLKIEKSKIIQKIQNTKGGHLIIAIIIGLVITYLTHGKHNLGYEVSIAFFCGILINELLNFINRLFSFENSNSNFIVKTGVISFIYLEVLDASFSFDGVIGAFAISTNIFIIMIGLGIGAMFVRSLTIFFVKNKTLNTFKYLEHGAHYAIGFLSFVLLSKTLIEIPEVITGLVSIGLIILALISSIKANKKILKL